MQLSCFVLPNRAARVGECEAEAPLPSDECEVWEFVTVPWSTLARNDVRQEVRSALYSTICLKDRCTEYTTLTSGCRKGFLLI